MIMAQSQFLWSFIYFTEVKPAYEVQIFNAFNQLMKKT